MYILKGFMSMPSLADDRKNVVAQFGEFSTYSATFSRDVRNYKELTQPDVELYVMYCVDEMLNRINPSASFRANVLAFGQWVFQQHMLSLIPQNKNKTAFIRAIEAEFPDMKNVEVGQILDSNTVAGRACPDYVKYRMFDGIINYQLTIWFSDPAFRTQYDEFEIDLIPPTDNINNLINDKLTVYNYVSKQTNSVVVGKIQDMVGDNPNTSLYPYDITWHDPSDFQSTLPTTWVAVIWGAAGNDIDAIKDAIRDYIAKNSDYDKWNEIYPDLYSETEFTMFPMWGKLALQDNAMEVGIYASNVKAADIRNHVKQFLPSGYAQSGKAADTFIEDHMFSGTAAYRTVSYGMVGNPNNKNEIIDLNVMYPDVNFALNSTDNDFGRMSLSTQGLCLKMNEALNVAREYDPGENLPYDYTRMARRGYYYVAFQYEGYTYAILTRYSYDKAMKDLENL